jgi:hypothetical protein
VGSIPASLVLYKVWSFITKFILDFKFFKKFVISFNSFFYTIKIEDIYSEYSSYIARKKIKESFKDFKLSDLLFSYFISIYNYKQNDKKILFRSYYRILKTDYGFYSNFNFLKNNYNYLNFIKNTFLVGFKYI